MTENMCISQYLYKRIKKIGGVIKRKKKKIPK